MIFFCKPFFPREIGSGLQDEEGGRMDEAGVLFAFTFFSNSALKNWFFLFYNKI